eukprot:12407906-Alexandrium_andersonii.AAC.1
MCTWRSHPKSRSPACAPSCARACVAPGLLPPGGRRCTPPSRRASDSPDGRRAHVASAMPSSMS